MSDTTFGDLRIENKPEFIVENMIKSKSCSIHKTFDEYNDQKSCYRFLWNEKVTEEKLINRLIANCADRVKDKDVLVVVDTSDIRIDKHKGRMTDFSGIGIIDSNQHKASYGFFIHPQYVLDEHNGTPYGLSGVEQFNRPMNSREDSKSERRREMRLTPIELKESYRWIGPCLESQNNALSSARKITFVMDREGDIWEVFNQVPGEKADIVIRSKTNRLIVNEQGKEVRLQNQLESQKSKGKLQIDFKDNGGRIRTTTAKIKFGSCKIKAPKHKKTGYSLPIYYVEVKSTFKQHGKPIHWILWTSRKVDNLEKAKQIVEIYRKRWEIEVFFKLLKSDGFDIENSQLEKGKSLRKLTLLVMEAAIKLKQLKAARSGGTDLMVRDIFDKNEIECLKYLNESLEGNTLKQKNPYSPEHLAWASWVIARLAGWKGFYGKDSPPGNKTFAEGLLRFEYSLFGFNLNN